MSEHTPGPWKASFGNLIRVFGASPGLVVCGVHKIGVQTGCYDTDAAAECVANARLIATAPEMLAALKAVLTARDKAAFAQAREVIAKAEGREQTSVIAGGK